MIFSFIPDDIGRSQMSVMFVRAKPYFRLQRRRLTLENALVPPPSHPLKESELLIALECSWLVHTVMQRLFPQWWLAPSETQVQDREEGIKVACALPHKLEGLTKSRGSKLIVLAQHGEVENSWEAMASERVLRCLSDPATRVLDLKPALSELKAEDPSRYHRLFYPDGHMTADGNRFVALEISQILTPK